MGMTLVLEDKLGQRCALPTYPQRSSNQRDQINRTIDESRLSANNPIASGTGPGGDIMSESGGEIISVRRGDFLGIRNMHDVQRQS
ncbi:hypothetical protein QA641_37080 [Bradyrhizobium sp. CB1650]|uniref:hypothetical protein n=1 Tax=Bradyrhizobium sp. CB1650 TaxID=3039153 RepID=UPI002434C25A|nr:hypothetical protein [Bradyrhizobium sp. CB1650]WGD51102.1 hypothetical protein QA641_37080 [Bradyrhizobium sp. CB1650]